MSFDATASVEIYGFEWPHDGPAKAETVADDTVDVVDVDDAFMHCAKCVVRSDLWNTEEWPTAEEVPNLAAALAFQAGVPEKADEIVAALDQNARDGLY